MAASPRSAVSGRHGASPSPYLRSGPPPPLLDGQSEKQLNDSNIAYLRAARSGHLDKVLESLQHGVDINYQNSNGLNALHLASKEGHNGVVVELIQQGIRVGAATKKGNTALHIASLAGKLGVVKILVEHRAKVNAQSQAGFTALYMAAQENQDKVVQYLLQNGANPSLTTEEGYTPLAVALQQKSDRAVTVLLEHGQSSRVKLPALHIAAKKDDVGAASLLLKSESGDKENASQLVNEATKSGFTPLHIASHYGNVNVAKFLIDKGATVNFKAKNSITPMHVASKWGQLNMVLLLYDRGGSVNGQTKDGLTPLHCAARSGYDRVVDNLLERGADHSAKTKSGLSALHMAAQGDHVDCARLLLHYRAQVNDVTVDLLTALHIAAHYGHKRTAKLLLDRNCDPNARALNGFTPLHIACKKNRIKVVELLLQYSAAVEHTTESGLTPLHVASFMGNMAIVLELLEARASVDKQTVRGETPLHLAARSSQTDVMRVLLRNKANVNAAAREQQTPLHVAARMGQVDNVMLLLQHGASPDALTKDGYTPLHITAKEGHEEAAMALMEQGASPNATTKRGMTPIHISAKYGKMGVARALLNRGANADAKGKNGLTPLHVAAHYNQTNVALLLLDNHASPHCTAKNGYTPLHIAAKKNQMDIATTLLEFGARPNAESKTGFTPLHLATQEGHTDMVSLLLEHSSSVNATASNGITPMHLCAQEDHTRVAEVLCKYRAVVDSKTNAGYTPLHTASHFGQLGMVRFLLEKGASVDAITRLGYTPLHQAAQQGHVLVINHLLKKGASPNAKTNTGVTPMAIARRLGYVSVDELLKSVTVESPGTEQIPMDRYRMEAPEKMEETFFSDTDEEGDEHEQYAFLASDNYVGMKDDAATPKDGFSEMLSPIGPPGASFRMSKKGRQPKAISSAYGKDKFPSNELLISQSSPMATETQQLDSLSFGSLSQGETMRKYWDGASADWALHPEDDSASKKEEEGAELGGVFIPPKGGHPNMYDVYREPKDEMVIEPVKAATAATGVTHYENGTEEINGDDTRDAPMPGTIELKPTQEQPDEANIGETFIVTASGRALAPATLGGGPVLGKDGKPVTLGSTDPSTGDQYVVSPDGTILTTNHEPVMHAGKIVRLEPSGDKVVLGPSGQLALDADRKPLVAPAGSELVRTGKDGKATRSGDTKPVLDSDGKMLILKTDKMLVVGPNRRAVGEGVEGTGRPVLVEQGSVLITPGMENYVVYLNGRPVLNNRSEPVCVPFGSTLSYADRDGTIKKRDGSVARDPGARPITVADPHGAYVVVTPNGDLILDSHGRPVRAPLDSELIQPTPEGYVMTSAGKRAVGSEGKAFSMPAGQKNALAVVDQGRVVIGPDLKPLSVLPGSFLSRPLPDGTVRKEDRSLVVNKDGEPVRVNPDAKGYLLLPDNHTLAVFDGEYVRPSSGSVLIVPGKDGKLKWTDGKKVVGSDGKSIKVDGTASNPGAKTTGKDPVIIELGNRLMRDSRGRAVKAPVGSSIVFADANGEIILPGKGTKSTPTKSPYSTIPDEHKLLVLPARNQVVIGADSEPVCGTDGKPVIVPVGSKLAVPGQMDYILGPDAKPVSDVSGQPIGVNPGCTVVAVQMDWCAYLPDGSKVTGLDGKPMKMSPGYNMAIGPDNKPVCDKLGKPLPIPPQSFVVTPRLYYILTSDGQPVVDEGGRGLTVDRKTIMLPRGKDGKAYLVSGEMVTDSVGRHVPVPTGKELLVAAGSGAPLLNGRGQPIFVPAGSTFAEPSKLFYIVDPARRVVENESGTPVYVTAGSRLYPGDPSDSYVTLPVDGDKLLSQRDNLPLKVPRGMLAAVAADGHPVTYETGEEVFVPVGSVIVPPGRDFVVDVDSNAVTDAVNGIAVHAEPGATLVEAGRTGEVLLPDGQKVLDEGGRPVKVTPCSLVLVDRAMKLVNDGSGRPHTVPRGSAVAPVEREFVMGPDGKPVAGDNGESLRVMPGTTVVPVDSEGRTPDGTAQDNQVAMIPGSTILIGPDGQPIEGPDGKAVCVPEGSKVSPPTKEPKVGTLTRKKSSTAKERPAIIEEIALVERANTVESSISPMTNGTITPPSLALSPPPIPSSLPPGSLPWTLFSTRGPSKDINTVEESYSGPTFGADFNPDNVIVDKSPIFTGFLVSYMVDARGGAMRGCRHAGVRMIIPPGKAASPIRVTCRMHKKEKIAHSPPLKTGEALAARIVELGPMGTRFLGPVVIEIPHFAAVSGRKEREVTVMRSEDGKIWKEHTVQPTDQLVYDTIGDSFDDVEPLDELEKKGIVRIVTTEFPRYFALVSRPKMNSGLIGPSGGILSSTVVPQVQAVFPKGALKKEIRLGIQAEAISPETIVKMFGNRSAVSAVVTVEPRRRKFHKSITMTIPLPRAATQGMINQYGPGSRNLRLLQSISDEYSPTKWEDITDSDSSSFSFVDDCISFTTTLSAKYWLVDLQTPTAGSMANGSPPDRPRDITTMAGALYRQAASVPFKSRFVVFARRREPQEASLRVFCMTDDKIDKTLEMQENFVEIARSRDIEVEDNRPLYVEMAGNLVPITKSGDRQVHMNFHAFRENRLPLTVKVRDESAEAAGRIAFMRNPKVAKGDPSQSPLCNLHLRLADAPQQPDPVSMATGSGGQQISEFEERYRHYRDLGIVARENVYSADLKLSKVAAEVGEDWRLLAHELGVSNQDVDSLEKEEGDGVYKAEAVLQLWVKAAGPAASGNRLSTALHSMKNKRAAHSAVSNVKLVTDKAEEEEARKRLGLSSSQESQEESSDMMTSQVTESSTSTAHDVPEQSISRDIAENQEAPPESPVNQMSDDQDSEAEDLLRYNGAAEDEDELVILPLLDDRRGVRNAPPSQEEQEMMSEAKVAALVELLHGLDRFCPTPELPDSDVPEEDPVCEAPVSTFESAPPASHDDLRDSDTEPRDRLSSAGSGKVKEEESSPLVGGGKEGAEDNQISQIDFEINRETAVGAQSPPGSELGTAEERTLSAAADSKDIEEAPEGPVIEYQELTETSYEGSRVTTKAAYFPEYLPQSSANQGSAAVQRRHGDELLSDSEDEVPEYQTYISSDDEPLPSQPLHTIEELPTSLPLAPGDHRRHEAIDITVATGLDILSRSGIGDQDDVGSDSMRASLPATYERSQSDLDLSGGASRVSPTIDPRHRHHSSPDCAMPVTPTSAISEPEPILEMNEDDQVQVEEDDIFDQAGTVKPAVEEEIIGPLVASTVEGASLSCFSAKTADSDGGSDGLYYSYGTLSRPGSIVVKRGPSAPLMCLGGDTGDSMALSDVTADFDAYERAADSGIGQQTSVDSSLIESDRGFCDQIRKSLSSESQSGAGGTNKLSFQSGGLFEPLGTIDSPATVGSEDDECTRTTFGGSPLPVHDPEYNGAEADNINEDQIRNEESGQPIPVPGDGSSLFQSEINESFDYGEHFSLRTPSLGLSQYSEGDDRTSSGDEEDKEDNEEDDDDEDDKLAGDAGGGDDDDDSDNGGRDGDSTDNDDGDDKGGDDGNVGDASNSHYDHEEKSNDGNNDDNNDDDGGGQGYSSVDTDYNSPDMSASIDKLDEQPYPDTDLISSELTHSTAESTATSDDTSESTKEKITSTDGEDRESCMGSSNTTDMTYDDSSSIPAFVNSNEGEDSALFSHDQVLSDVESRAAEEAIDVGASLTSSTHGQEQEISPQESSTDDLTPCGLPIGMGDTSDVDVTIGTGDILTDGMIGTDINNGCDSSTSAADDADAYPGSDSCTSAADDADVYPGLGVSGSVPMDDVPTVHAEDDLIAVPMPQDNDGSCGFSSGSEECDTGVMNLMEELQAAVGFEESEDTTCNSWSPKQEAVTSSPPELAIGSQEEDITGTEDEGINIAVFHDGDLEESTDITSHDEYTGIDAASVSDDEKLPADDMVLSSGGDHAEIQEDAEHFSILSDVIQVPTLDPVPMSGEVVMSAEMHREASLEHTQEAPASPQQGGASSLESLVGAESDAGTSYGPSAASTQSEGIYSMAFGESSGKSITDHSVALDIHSQMATNIEETDATELAGVSDGVEMTVQDDDRKQLEVSSPKHTSPHDQNIVASGSSPPADTAAHRTLGMTDSYDWGASSCTSDIMNTSSTEASVIAATYDLDSGQVINTIEGRFPSSVKASTSSSCGGQDSLPAGFSGSVSDEVFYDGSRSESIAATPDDERGRSLEKGEEAAAVPSIMLKPDIIVISGSDLGEENLPETGDSQQCEPNTQMESSIEDNDYDEDNNNKDGDDGDDGNNEDDDDDGGTILLPTAESTGRPLVFVKQRSTDSAGDMIEALFPAPSQEEDTPETPPDLASDLAFLGAVSKGPEEGFMPTLMEDDMDQSSSYDASDAERTRTPEPPEIVNSPGCGESGADTKLTEERPSCESNTYSDQRQTWYKEVTDEQVTRQETSNVDRDNEQGGEAENEHDVDYPHSSHTASSPAAERLADHSVPGDVPEAEAGLVRRPSDVPPPEPNTEWDTLDATLNSSSSALSTDEKNVEVQLQSIADMDPPSGTSLQSAAEIDLEAEVESSSERDGDTAVSSAFNFDTNSDANIQVSADADGDADAESSVCSEDPSVRSSYDNISTEMACYDNSNVGEMAGYQDDGMIVYGDIEEMEEIDDDEESPYSIYQDRQLSAVEELSESSSNERLFDQRQLQRVSSLDNILQELAKSSRIVAGTATGDGIPSNLSEEQPFQQFENKDESNEYVQEKPTSAQRSIDVRDGDTAPGMSSPPDDDYDLSSVDSFATVVRHDEEGEELPAETEDRLAEISSLTSSFQSDHHQISQTPPPCFVMERPPRVNRSDSMPSPILLRRSMRFPTDPDSVSTTSSLLEFETLECDMVSTGSQRSSLTDEVLRPSSLPPDIEFKLTGEPPRLSSLPCIESEEPSNDVQRSTRSSAVGVETVESGEPREYEEPTDEIIEEAQKIIRNMEDQTKVMEEEEKQFRAKSEGEDTTPVADDGPVPVVPLPSNKGVVTESIEKSSTDDKPTAVRNIPYSDRTLSEDSHSMIESIGEDALKQAIQEASKNVENFGEGGEGDQTIFDTSEQLYQNRATMTGTDTLDRVTDKNDVELLHERESELHENSCSTPAATTELGQGNGSDVASNSSYDDITELLPRKSHSLSRSKDSIEEDNVSGLMTRSSDSIEEDGSSDDEDCADSITAHPAYQQMTESVDSIEEDYPIMERSSDSIECGPEEMAASVDSIVSSQAMVHSTDSMDHSEQPSTGLEQSCDSLDQVIPTVHTASEALMNLSHRSGDSTANTNEADDLSIGHCTPSKVKEDQRYSRDENSGSMDSLDNEPSASSSLQTIVAAGDFHPKVADTVSHSDSFSSSASVSHAPSRSDTSPTGIGREFSRTGVTPPPLAQFSHDPYESDYQYMPRRKVFTMADVEAEREAKRKARVGSTDSLASSVGGGSPPPPTAGQEETTKAGVGETAAAAASCDSAPPSSSASLVLGEGEAEPGFGCTRVTLKKTLTRRTPLFDPAKQPDSGIMNRAETSALCEIIEEGDSPPPDIRETIDALTKVFNEYDHS